MFCDRSLAISMNSLSLSHPFPVTDFFDLLLMVMSFPAAAQTAMVQHCYPWSTSLE